MKYYSHKWWAGNHSLAVEQVQADFTIQSNTKAVFINQQNTFQTEIKYSTQCSTQNLKFSFSSKGRKCRQYTIKAGALRENLQNEWTLHVWRWKLEWEMCEQMKKGLREELLASVPIIAIWNQTELWCHKKTWTTGMKVRWQSLTQFLYHR